MKSNLIYILGLAAATLCIYSVFSFYTLLFSDEPISLSNNGHSIVGLLSLPFCIFAITHFMAKRNPENIYALHGKKLVVLSFLVALIIFETMDYMLMEAL